MVGNFFESETSTFDLVADYQRHIIWLKIIYLRAVYQRILLKEGHCTYTMLTKEGIDDVVNLGF